MKKYLKLMRVKHYIKNILVFLPFIFSGQFFKPFYLVRAVVGFFAFCLLSSAIYIFNDIRDVERDRLHPTKKNRPIANGSISKRAAYLLGACLLLATAVLQYFSQAAQWYAWLILLVYLLLNIAYSMKLKNIPIVDIAILVSGYVLRVLYGSALGGIEISRWLYLTVISMSFYLGLGKRRNELIRQDDLAKRNVLQFYNQSFLDKNMYMCLALTIAFYSLWAVDPLTIARINTENIVWTVPLVILICMSYSLHVERDSDGDPVEVLLGDKLLLSLVVLLGLIWVGIIYL